MSKTHDTLERALNRHGTTHVTPNLPSLNALLAFDSAARHESFTRAARELGVTQTAVSHQIKALEAELGVLLFRRSPKRLSLTEDGLAWSAELRVIFQRLRDANVRLRSRSRSERPVVSVTTIPSFGARWLVPRLGKFMTQHADIDVRISANEQLVDFGLEPFDLGIRYGSGRYSGLVTEKLAEDAWVVVCAPGLPGRNRLKTPADLAKVPLLCDDHPDAWSAWFGATSRECPAFTARSEYTDSSMLVEAALRGQGVALARWSLACDELENGRLELPFPKEPPVRTGRAYYLVGPREAFRRPPVAAFRDWLRVEARGLRTFGGSSSSTRHMYQLATDR
ncbi:MAG TPA: transcriptional regulator GcvA [Polyangiaceae bacterium]|nr:transcriptional regulator GcvA [Polyangiaceae bacterium]